jgi:hypothetical protein
MASDQLFTLAGVVIGGGLSFAAAQWSDQRRRAHERSTRWMQARYNAYAEYTASVKQVVRVSRALATSESDPGLLANVERAKVNLIDAENQRSEAFERVVLLASPRVISAGIALNFATWDLERPARQGERMPADEWQESTRPWLDCLNSFHEAARIDLGVPADLSSVTSRSSMPAIRKEHATDASPLT